MKEIPGFRNRYSVTEDGQVFSLPKRGGCKDGKMLRYSTNRDGYKKVALYDVSGIKKWFSVHRLVALTYIPNDSRFPQVNHKNGKKSDNRVENLEWCTRDENRIHALKNGLDNKGERNWSAKITKMDVLKIRELSRRGISYADIAREFPIHYVTVSLICRRKRWKHI